MIASLLLAIAPHIVVIMLDDATKLDMQIMTGGLLPAVTSNITSHATEFTNSFTTRSLCAPSRATFLTGKYAHNHGVIDNNSLAALDESDTVATRLHAAGYRTIHVGKYVNGYDGSYVPAGWDDWNGLINPTYSVFDYSMRRNATTVTYGHAPADYKTEVLADIAASAMTAGLATEQPVFLYVAPAAPHVEDSTIMASLADGLQAKDQWTWYARPDMRDMLLKPVQWSYILSTLPFYPGFAPSLNEADITDKPAFMRLPLMDSTDLTRNQSQYRLRMLCLLGIDDIVSKIAAVPGFDSENTVWILTSDNGFSYGFHRRSQKLTAYEESIRVPLYIAGPQIAHRTEDRIALNNDLAPTILELAGAAANPAHDGRSLAPLLHGLNPTWRNRFLVEGNDTPNIVAPPPFDAVRTGPNDTLPQRLLVEYVTGDRELYILPTDQYELSNVAATNLTEVSALQGRIAALNGCAGATCLPAEN